MPCETKSIYECCQHTEKIQNMANICRVCLEPSKLMYPLFGEILHVDVDIATMLSYCTATEVELEEDLPDSVCVMCFKTTRIAYNFIQKFKKSQILLHERKGVLEKSVENVEYIEIRVEESNDMTDETETYSENIQDKIEDGTNDNHCENYVNDEENFSEEANLTPNLVEYASKSENNYNFEQLMVVSESFKNLNDVTSESNNEMSDINLTNETVGQVIIMSKERFDKGTGKHTAIQRNHLCPICKKTYTKFQTLVNHLVLHDNIIFPCTKCTDIFNSTSDFLEHYKVLHLYQCRKCSKSFKSKSTYQNHIKKAHSQVVTRFLCKYENCGKSFNFKHSLRRHEVEHQEHFNYVCKVCYASFKGYDKFRYHTKISHGGERPHLCTVCGKTFVQATHLKDHMWLHTGIKRYQCKNCSKAYTSSSHLKKHVKKNCCQTIEVAISNPN